MSYYLTIKTGPGTNDVEHRTAVGNLAALMDAAYDAGALGFSAIEIGSEK